MATDEDELREQLAEAERRRDEWCEEYTKLRDVLYSIQDAIAEALKEAVLKDG